ncbi:hypothetical protein LCGC14_1195400 [marine sediment metagenome]|uniref:Uncharacterized protein n=1 Tax=marine sediment metagenome TaxID=412755 RepID=A0A0F9LN06_9ZZZZ
MGKMVIVDDEGNQEEFNHFIAVGIKEGGEIANFVEDGGLPDEPKLALLLQGVRLLGVLEAELGQGDPEEG